MEWNIYCNSYLRTIQEIENVTFVNSLLEKTTLCVIEYYIFALKECWIFAQVHQKVRPLSNFLPNFLGIVIVRPLVCRIRKKEKLHPKMRRDNAIGNEVHNGPKDKEKCLS